MNHPALDLFAVMVKEHTGYEKLTMDVEFAREVLAEAESLRAWYDGFIKAVVQREIDEATKQSTAGES